MSIEIRSLNGVDAHTHSVLMNHAFGKGRVVDPPAAEATPEAPKDTYGIFEGGALQAALSIVPFITHWGATRTLAMGGIAGVATFASARGRGYADQLLRRSLEIQKEAGQTISALNPFAWKFYQKQGWDWVGRRHEIKLPLRELPSFPGGKEVIPIADDAARERLEPICTRFSRQYRGVFTAETRKWDGALGHGDGRTTHVYQHPASGAYLLWRYNNDNSGGNIREFIADTPEGYRALLGLLHYMGTQCDHANLILPADTPLWNHFYHWDMETKLRPVFMGRVVDFLAALKEIEVAPAVEGQFTLSLRDAQAPWNQGVWRVTLGGGKAGASLILGEASPDLQMDIRALSQAFWGTPSAAEARDAGLIAVANEDAFALFSRLFPSAPVYTLDFF